MNGIDANRFEKINLFVTVVLFACIFLLVRPIMLGQKLDSNSILVNAITFIIWLSLTRVFTTAIVGKTPNMNDFNETKTHVADRLVCPVG
jgi:formate hydrogenlyase subunit 4